MSAATAAAAEISKETLGFGAIEEVGPGGHFFGAADTLTRYDTAFYEPMLSDWRNFETWQDGGSLTATDRANALWKKMLEDYEEPPMDEAMKEELHAFIDRRKTEIESAAA